MNRYIAASAALIAVTIASLLSTSANAQLAVAKVVATCGTTSPTPSPGTTYPLTIDITGTLCSVGGGGGGGGGTSSNFGATFPGAGTAAGFEYLLVAPTLTSGQMVAGQTDVNGNLKVNVVSGGGSNASVGATGSAVPGSGTYVGINVGGTLTGAAGTTHGLTVDTDTSGNLISAVKAPIPAQSSHGVNIGGVEGLAADGAAPVGNPVLIAGSDGTDAQTILTSTSGHVVVDCGSAGGSCSGSGGTSAADKSTWTVSSSLMTVGGCEFTTGGATALTTGQMGAVGCTAARAQFTDKSSVGGTALTAAVSAYGTAPTGTAVEGVNAFVTNSNANGSAVSANSSPVVIASDQSAVPVSPTTYPATAVPITASATGTTAATTATLTNVTSHTTYICGFSIRANASAAATGNATVTGTKTATMNFTQWTAPNASGLGVTEEVFSPCVPASAVSTSIAVVSAAPGTGGVVSVTAWGYLL